MEDACWENSPGSNPNEAWARPSKLKCCRTVIDVREEDVNRVSKTAQSGGGTMSSNISDPALWSRFQFGFTLTYHYLFHSGGVTDHRRRCYFPGDARFHSCAGELADRLFCRFRREPFAPRLHLVAGGFRSGSRLFRLHLATLCGESQRKAGHPGILPRAVMRAAAG